MKIWNLHLTWQTSRQEELLRIQVKEHLRDIETRQAIARMARSEVKNYMAEICEQAEHPFVSPVGFIRGINLVMRQTASTGYSTCQCDCANCSGCTADDSPFTTYSTVDNAETFNTADYVEVGPPVETLPNGHTTTCSCPDKDK